MWTRLREEVDYGWTIRSFFRSLSPRRPLTLAYNRTAPWSQLQAEVGGSVPLLGFLVGSAQSPLRTQFSLRCIGLNKNQAQTQHHEPWHALVLFNDVYLMNQDKLLEKWYRGA